MTTCSAQAFHSPTYRSGPATSTASPAFILHLSALLLGLTFFFSAIYSNLTGDGAAAYTYDNENRLTKAVKGAVTSTYAYEPTGRRLSKTVKTKTTRYLNAGDQEIGEYSVSGTTTALTQRIVYGAGLDEPITYVAPNGTKTYAQQDAQGSVVAITDATGKLTTRYAYGPYGESSTLTGVARFTGRRIDPETGLYYYRARMYSPALGRFLQQDPIGTSGGVNLYAYVGNDPVNLVDPMGTSCVSSSGTTTCGTLNYLFRLPTPVGWQDMQPDTPHAHQYDIPVNAGNIPVSSVRQAIINDPTPGNDQPASSIGTLNNASPSWMSGFIKSPVLSYTTTNEITGNPIVVNLTVGEHPLRSGYVVREAYEAPGGTIVHNYGEGNGILQDRRSPFANFIDNTWNDQTNNLLGHLK
jgi:RHS repeat-associated protein